MEIKASVDASGLELHEIMLDDLYNSTSAALSLPEAQADIERMKGFITDLGELGIPPLMFLSYMLIPLSVGMFPHLFQHWLTAKSAKTFRLTLVAHPLFIMIVWVPCV